VGIKKINYVNKSKRSLNPIPSCILASVSSPISMIIIYADLLIRNQYIGFVFQQFNLLPRLTALENVMLPMIYADVSRSERIQSATVALEKIGLGDRLTNRPSQLSGGQQQRVAIARALVNHPALVLADEPTGALDSKTSHEIMNLLTELNQEGTTIAIVTHDATVAAQTKRVIQMQDGVIVERAIAALG
jgi:putative ABC transport system ATP-binding protein